MIKHFYERNTELIDSLINKTFEDILWMSEDEFRQWVIDMRKEVVRLWDDEGKPPRVGYDKSQIIEQFNRMTSYPVKEFLVQDELTGEFDVIRNTSNLGNAVNQWFPTMMKTRINYTKDVEKGKSIYDYFLKESLLDTFVTYASRHFKRDSFYHYSRTIKQFDTSWIENGKQKLPIANTGVEWITEFEKTYRNGSTYDYWLQAIDEEKEYSGHNEKLKTVKYLTVTKDEIEYLPIPEKCKTNLDYSKSEVYRIRAYEYGQKLFPIGLSAFRVSFCQYAVNFPPLTAKYLYERYTEDFKNQDVINIYDPSMGWGGRIIGAMSVDEDPRTIHYIGTDPNKDHNIENGLTKYHDIVNFFNEKSSRATSLFPKLHSVEIFQDGSEVIHNNLNFQKYKNKLDLIFTSPPYFAKEAYSEDEEQSYKKFSQYDLWREGFLRQTLKTCAEYLREERYLLWNIADAAFDGDMLPLEKDSIEILKEYGLEYKGKLKMSLAKMPGGNRIDKDTGLPKAKNFCKVNGIWLKYEPIFVFFKPKQ